MQKLITRRRFPSLLFFTTVGFGTISCATTLKAEEGGGRSVVLFGAAPPQPTLTWLLTLAGGYGLARCPGTARPGPGSARRRLRRFPPPPLIRVNSCVAARK